MGIILNFIINIKISIFQWCIAIPIGVALLNLTLYPNDDNTFKGILEASFPEEFNMSRALINKIIHALPVNQDAFQSTQYFNYSDNKIIFAKPHNIDSENKELIVFLTDQTEISNNRSTEEFLNKINEKADIFYRTYTSKAQRILNFDSFAGNFFLEKTKKKLLFIGFAGAGKTCIKSAFFEGADPKQLLSDLGAPEPTFGIQHYTYSWLDTEVGTVDSSGQEFERYISGDSFEREMTFGFSDAVIYIFDVNNWLEEQEKVIENLKKIIISRDDASPDAKLYAFCHKIDLITDDSKKRARIFTDIKGKLQKDLGIKTVFTSIDPNYIHTLFRSLQIILNDLSKVGSTLESFLKEIMQKMTSAGVILVDEDFKVISERHSKDISIKLVDGIITLLKTINLSFKRLEKTDFMDYGIITSKQKVTLLIKKIENAKFGISYIVIASKKASKNTLGRIVAILEEKVTANAVKIVNPPPPPPPF
ncbi:MAG: hypothetical protein ACTSWY_09200 [Promethearchaeota archaeon]